MSDPRREFVCDNCNLLVANGPELETPVNAMSLLPGIWCSVGHEYQEEESGCTATDANPDNCEFCDRESWSGSKCPGCGDTLGAFYDLHCIERVSSSGDEE